MKKRQSTDDFKELESKGIFTRIGTTGKGTYYILKGAPKGRKGHFIGHISHVSDNTDKCFIGFLAVLR